MPGRFADGLVDDPDPGFVGGFNLWRALGRGVNRGQHGYAVLAPCRYDRRVATDGEGNSRLLSRGEAGREGEQIEVRKVLAGFRAEYVFSVHQTSGAELPEPPRPKLLVGEAPVGLGAAVLEMIEAHGFRVDTVADAGAIAGANGVTRWDSRVVLVRADMDDAAMVKTLIHEAAHVLLHAGPPGQFLPRPLKEVEAESVAYVVASAHGMATGDYSFPYVAAWAGVDGPKAIQATQARVASAARADHRGQPSASHPWWPPAGLRRGSGRCGSSSSRAEQPLRGRRRGQFDRGGAVRADTQPSAGVDLVMGGMAAAVGLGAVLWGAGAASAWLAGHQVPDGKPLAGYAAFGHFGDPSRAWSAPSGSGDSVLDVHALGLGGGRDCVLGRMEALALRALSQGGRPGASGRDGHRLAGAPCCRGQSVVETVGDTASIPASAASRRCRLPAGLLEGGGLLGERGGFDPAFGPAPLR